MDLFLLDSAAIKYCLSAVPFVKQGVGVFCVVLFVTIAGTSKICQERSKENCWSLRLIASR